MTARADKYISNLGLNLKKFQTSISPTLTITTPRKDEGELSKIQTMVMASIVINPTLRPSSFHQMQIEHLGHFRGCSVFEKLLPTQ